MTRIYQSPNIGDAQVRVALVRSIGQADLLVHRVSSWGLARGGALWYITRNKQDAQVYVYMCSLGMAQLRVCFVNTYGQAGWINTDHPLAKRVFKDAKRLLHGDFGGGGTTMGTMGGRPSLLDR
jgi:hypothetical protein